MFHFINAMESYSSIYFSASGKDIPFWFSEMTDVLSFNPIACCQDLCPISDMYGKTLL